jgi:hypothetical protein
MTIDERIELLGEAYDAITLALRNIQKATIGTSQQGPAQWYLIKSLQTLLDTTDPSISGLMEYFEDLGGYQEDEDFVETPTTPPNYGW